MPIVCQFPFGWFFICPDENFESSVGQVASWVRHWICGRSQSGGFPACPSESRWRCPYCIEAYSLTIPIHLAQVRNWSRWFDLCHLKGVVVGVDQPWVGLSPPNLVTAIVSLRLMALDASPHRPNVWTQALLDSIVTQLASYQGDWLVPLLWDSSPFDGTWRNDFHFMKSCMSHNGIVWRQIVDH